MFFADQSSKINDLKVARKALLTTSTVSLLACLAFAPNASAQVNPPDGSMIEITDDTAVINPGVGTTINIAEGVTQTIQDSTTIDDRLNANILLDGDGDNDDVTITNAGTLINLCLLYTSPSPRDQRGSRMPSSA